MSYSKTTWQTGDTVTAELLNHMEDGIAAGESVYVVTGTRYQSSHDFTIDHSFTDIRNAAAAGKIVVLVCENWVYHMVYNSAQEIDFEGAFRVVNNNEINKFAVMSSGPYRAVSTDEHVALPKLWTLYAEESNGTKVVDSYYLWGLSELFTEDYNYYDDNMICNLVFANEGETPHYITSYECDMYPLLKFWSEELYNSQDEYYYTAYHWTFGKMVVENSTPIWRTYEAVLDPENSGDYVTLTESSVVLTSSGSPMNPTI